MEVNTPIAEDIRMTDQNARYDAACRKLLSEKIILAWIMKSCLEEYRNCDVKEIAEKYIEGTPQVGEVAVMPGETNATKVQGISNEDAVPCEGRITYDIRFVALVPGTDEMIQLIINVEAQGKFNTGYPMIKRAIFHCSRMISAQYGTEFIHSEYQKIKKVYSIFVCMTPPQKRQNSITRYRLTEENLVGSVKEAVQNYDLLSGVILCLGGSDGENYDGVLKLLDVLLSSEAGVAEKRQILQDDFDIPMTETLESEVQAMCNLSQGVEEKGRIKVRGEGRTEGLWASIRNLMASMGWTVDQAMAALKIPEEDRPKYAKMLNN